MWRHYQPEAIQQFLQRREFKTQDESVVVWNWDQEKRHHGGRTHLKFLNPNAPRIKEKSPVEKDGHPSQQSS
jgi:hypothetical protein